MKDTLRNSVLAGLVLLLAMPVSRAEEPGKSQYQEVGESCAATQDPLVCMESYGFRCEQSWNPEASLGGQHLACNVDLGGGRKHFVQMVFDGAEWRFDSQHSYDYKPRTPRMPQEKASDALAQHFRQSMARYQSHTRGTGSDGERYYKTFSDTHRVDGRVEVIAACGMTGGPVNEGSNENSDAATLVTKCEQHLLDTVISLGQSKPGEVYRIAALSDTAWEKNIVTLLSGDTALIVEGRYQFEKPHTPCREISDCCPRDGSYYLNSCRTPTEQELHVIEACLATEDRVASEEFTTCLRSGGVKVGCELQPDGSRICY